MTRAGLFCFLIYPLATSQAGVTHPSHDVVVYGGTSAGVIAAVQVQRMGKSVVIVCPERHLGGLTAGGLGFTDTGNKAVIGGLARQFYHRIWQKYQEPSAWRWQAREEYGNKGQGTPAIDGQERTMWIFEPHVAEAAFEDLIAEAGITVHRESWLDREKGVTRRDGRIMSISTLGGETFPGKMFIDATYEGDLMAAAGVSYHVGREASSVYGEKWNGIQVGVLHHAHFFADPVDPYVVPGDPSSGLLPRISDKPPGVKGEGDQRIQAYCYRMCLSNHPDNRISFVRPVGYDPFQYVLLLRVFDTGWRQTFNKFDPIPNRKTDTNNHGPFSTDNIGANYDYPEASYERRREILAEHELYQKGLMYFLANDSRVPGDVREAMSQWGLPRDEFTDNGGWPHQIYVREARRMIGPYVMTEQDCLDTRETPGSVGMGSYTMDSHNVQRYVTPEGTVQNEGDIGVPPPRPYQIAYASLTPKRAECENLLVPVCLSSSHIAYGSIRMEPVFMILGQSAATAAALAIDRGEAVQDLPYEVLRGRLLADQQVLEFASTKTVKVAALEGLVIDDSEAVLEGTWAASAALSPFVGAGYQHDRNTDKGKLAARFMARVPPGRYEVRVAYSASANRATNVPITISHAQGTSTARLNQRAVPAHDGLTTTIGTYLFSDTAEVTVTNLETDGHVVIDAIQLITVSPES